MRENRSKMMSKLPYGRELVHEGAVFEPGEGGGGNGIDVVVGVEQRLELERRVAFVLDKLHPRGKTDQEEEGGGGEEERESARDRTKREKEEKRERKRRGGVETDKQTDG